MQLLRPQSLWDLMHSVLPGLILLSSILSAPSVGLAAAPDSIDLYGAWHWVKATGGFSAPGATLLLLPGYSLVLSLKPSGTYEYVEQDSSHEWLLCAGKLEIIRMPRSGFVLSFANWWKDLDRYQYVHFIGRDTLSTYPRGLGSVEDAPTQILARGEKAVSEGSRLRGRTRLSGNPPQPFFVNTDPREGEFVYYEEAPVPITKVQPAYPDFAKEARIEGKVILHVLVGRDGLVWDARVFRGVRGLDEAALDAVKKWVFKPAMSNNKPVAVWIEVPLSFPP